MLLNSITSLTTTRTTEYRRPTPALQVAAPDCSSLELSFTQQANAIDVRRSEAPPASIAEVVDITRPCKIAAIDAAAAPVTAHMTST